VLRRLLKGVEVERPVPGNPWDLRMADDVLEAMGVILERLQEAYTSGHDPWD
jgi:hypothetical protein